jgi:GTP pyrophosphokinase
MNLENVRSATGDRLGASWSPWLDPRDLDIARLVAEQRSSAVLLALEAREQRVSASLEALASEARELLVPLTERLGLGALSSRLEDACFRILEPNEYLALTTAMEATRPADEQCLTRVLTRVSELLETHGMTAEVTARLKNTWGVYQKLQRHLPFEHILDRIGLRVVVSSVDDCYRVLGLVHEHFRAIPGTFDDYILRPKKSGYQSLHTCVRTPTGSSSKPVELQIRTLAMHRECEVSHAALWRYKTMSNAS